METDVEFEGLDNLAGKLDMSAHKCVDGIAAICGKTIREFDKLPLPVTTLELSVVFLNDDDIHKINLQYRHIDAPTDVLSFPLWENENGIFDPPSSWHSLPLGDIMICPNIVANNASDNGKIFEEELILVLFHGFLHLIGFDHDTEEKRNIMWTVQDKMVQDYFEKMVE